MKKNYKSIEKKIVKFIKSEIGPKQAIVGLSGGIDSAVVAYLAVKALGSKKVFGIMTPSSANVSDDLRLAKKVVRNLKVKSSVIEIEPIIKIMEKKAGFFKKRLPHANLTARIRMIMLYGKANELDAIVLGTGNKSELMTGYFTKHGDGAADILPIGDLYKTEERGLAGYLGVPEEIINRTPTAGLWKGQEDEKEMGVSYEELDLILEALDKKKSLGSFSQAKVNKVKKMMAMSEHKRELPPVCQP
ncbi:NAD+ synthase [Patescibacteria group bacterium]|nr:NAD+ synthase [Patescibacteria group bacterium]MBU1673510.1 NAD+ synthase [Patescibacteria group bacterium]MBU1963744.1 NAD+ synthase [Patescibacteria group bacterium]